MNQEQSQRATIEENLKLFLQDGQVTELRVLKHGERGITLSGYFDAAHLDEMAAYAVAAEGECKGVYFALNPLATAILKRRPNDVGWARNNELTKDKDVPALRWLLLDVDPDRPAGVSATEQERALAFTLLEAACDFLCGKAWPKPLRADSGNGYHGCYRVNLPTDDSVLVKRVLNALADRFNTPGATLDRAVYNPSRIVRLYGTLARKGPNSEERPHRRSQILDPGDNTIVSRQQLEALVDELALEAPPPKQTKRKGTPIRPAPASVLKRAEAYLAVLPPAISGQHGHDRCFRAACALVVGFALTVEEARPLLEQYNARCEPPWSDAELAHKLEDAAKKAAEEADSVGHLLNTGKKDKASGESSLGPVDLLIELATASAELFHDPDGTPYAWVRVDGRGDTIAIETESYRLWLVGGYYRVHGTAPRDQWIKEAVAAIAAKARFDSGVRKVYLRVGRHEGHVLLDLANDRREVVEVGPDGWRICPQSPICFRRPKGMLALPVPQHGGNINELRPFVNVATEDDFRLLVAFTLMAFRPDGPYPVLLLTGEHGSAKSTTSQVLRDLVDPSKAELRKEPKEVRDFWVAAHNSWLLALDNLSRVEPWLSDSLCTLSSGGGFSTRALYTDDEEKIFYACRPIVINSITDVIWRPDLLDRTVTITCPVISEAGRQTRRKFWPAFKAAQPRILGALLDGVARALANEDKLDLEILPRLADFAVWGAAAEPAFGWPEGSFMDSFWANISATNEVALESDLVATHLRRFLSGTNGWPTNPKDVKTAEDLLRELTQMVGGDLKAAKIEGWPKRPRDLSGRLRRLAPVLRRIGIDIQWLERETTGDRKRPLRITVKTP